jgi:hypothetical protein
MNEGWECPGENERETEITARLIVGVIHCQHYIFKVQESAWVDLKADVKVDGSGAGLFGVKVHFPELAQ